MSIGADINHHQIYELRKHALSKIENFNAHLHGMNTLIRDDMQTNHKSWWKVKCMVKIARMRGITT